MGNYDGVLPKLNQCYGVTFDSLIGEFEELWKLMLDTEQVAQEARDALPPSRAMRSQPPGFCPGFGKPMPTRCPEPSVDGKLLFFARLGGTGRMHS